MKLTAHKREWVLAKVRHYCSLLLVEPPRVIMTGTEYEVWKKAKREERVGRLRKVLGFEPHRKPIKVGRSSFTNYLGVCHRADKMIVVFVKKSQSLRRLDDTIRHELIHYAKPSYNHCSAEFRDRMERLRKGNIKNGKF